EYGSNGNITPCFLASNHTTGGNSGSPVLNAYGQLIGTNFDRVWEGTMSDIMFDPERCRNISLDIRYTLFIIDKFAGARWLVDEMNIVKLEVFNKCTAIRSGILYLHSVIHSHFTQCITQL